MPRSRHAFVSLSLCVAVAGVACSRSGPRADAAGKPRMPVKIEVARALPLADAAEYVATLKSRASAVIMPQVEGQVTQILVRSGDRVRAGTPLLQIDPAKQQAALKSQEDTRAAKRAALDLARQQHERAKALHAEGVVSQQELDQATSARDAAQAELLSLEAQVKEQQVELRYYRVEAPTDGIVGDIPVRVGDRVTVSTPLTSIDQPGALEAYVAVPVERASQLARGLELELLDAAGAPLAKSALDFVSPRADDQTQTVLVKATLRNANGTLRPSQMLRARIVFSTREGLAIPVLAVSRVSGQHFAFVAEGEDGALVARQRKLRLGSITGNAYQVLEGIAPGDRVIVSGTQLLADGTPVAPQG
jgi:RND family efflux transporter MFP subunit